jgi:hypothetical protein
MESDPAWADRVRAALTRYDETLLRAVAGRLFKPRSQWPVEDLIDRVVETLNNPPVIDRRVKDFPPAGRTLLAAVGLSRCPDWSVGQLLALLAALGHTEGAAPVLQLLDNGLAFPILPDEARPIRSWEDWLGTDPTTARLMVPTPVADRAAREGVSLPQLPGKKFDPRPVHSADGLEWFLRLGVVWQQLRAVPVRLTQSNTLFKRDLMRLQADPLLDAPLPEPTGELPEAGVLAMQLGTASGLFVTDGGELRAGSFPASWDAGLGPAVAGLWAALPGVSQWDPVRGYLLVEGGEPFATVTLAAMLLLAAQPDGVWTHPAELAEFLAPRHPGWLATLGRGAEESEDWIERMALGWAVPLKLLDAAQDGEGWWIRLSPLGRHLLSGSPAPVADHAFPHGLVVQPNGDVVAYRQGLTPGLIAKLSRFADWKMIGPACTLGLSAESVYRGLESGLTLSDILTVLQQHSAHPVPANVRDLIRRWAGKRERITVHTAATLLEFNTPADLEAALARGLVSQKITDRIGLADGEVEYRHFRLLGNRDYETKPQKCLTFAPDGVTFAVDVSASDLLLEAELSRLAERVDGEGPERKYRITPATARAVREQGFSLTELEQWCVSRSGFPLSPAARLLFAGSGGMSAEVRTRLVVTLPNEVVTDGVCQWPATADLLDERLGPCAVAVSDENLSALLTNLKAVGVEGRPA